MWYICPRVSVCCFVQIVGMQYGIHTLLEFLHTVFTTPCTLPGHIFAVWISEEQFFRFDFD